MGTLSLPGSETGHYCLGGEWSSWASRRSVRQCGDSLVSESVEDETCSVLCHVLLWWAAYIQNATGPDPCWAKSSEYRHLAVCISAFPHSLCSQIKLTPPGKTSFECPSMELHTIRFENIMHHACMTHLRDSSWPDDPNHPAFYLRKRVQKKRLVRPVQKSITQASYRVWYLFYLDLQC